MHLVEHRFRRPMGEIAKSQQGKELEQGPPLGTAVGECASGNYCPFMSQIGQIADDRLVALVRIWPRLSGQIQRGILGIIESPEVGLAPSRNLIEDSQATGSLLSENTLKFLARKIARECRAIIQGCLREEEWPDADEEFFRIIHSAIGDL